MRCCTRAAMAEVQDAAPEAQHLDHERGLTTFTLSERDAECALYELKRAGIAVWSGGPRVSRSSPRAYASASSHIRRW
jgi:hypothetical protein